MTLFIILSLTGLPQKFYEAGWAQAIIVGLGGIDRVRWVHRVAGILFTLLTAIHMTVAVGLVVIGRAGAVAGADAAGLPRRHQHAALLPGRVGRAGEVRPVRLQAEVRVLGPGARRGDRDQHRPGPALPDRRHPVPARRDHPRREAGARQRGADGLPRRHRLAHLQRAPQPRRLPVRHDDLHREDQRRAAAPRAPDSSTSALKEME